MTETEIRIAVFLGAVFCLLAFIVFLPAIFARTVNFIFQRNLCHVWRYHRHARRTCKLCGMHQDTYCMAWDLHDARRGWWETMCPVPLNPCGLKAKKDDR